MRILFILKERFYSQHKAGSYGLINSAKQVAEFLESIGNECKIVEVIDANSIDKEVFLYRPDLVVIEALWVSGDKMKELIEIPRYKHIKWAIRVHSNIGFLSAETLALKYINDYIELKKHNLYIALNNDEMNDHLSDAINYKFVHLPNIINIKYDSRHKEDKHHIDIGCFGSLRILKNQLFQAVCAMNAADKIGKKLKFHITADVDEESKVKNPVLKNLEELFKNSKHELIIHSWLENIVFQHIISEMDIGMQLSYTESFNIVSADFINNDRLILVSPTISWMPGILQVSTVDYDEVVNKLVWLYKHKDSFILKWYSRIKLIMYNTEAKSEWVEFIHKIK
jgi:hypothetical protein